MNTSYHIPVMLEACVEGLVLNPDGVYVDVTFGGGGHSRKILEHLSEKGRLIAFDQDEDAQRNMIDDPRFTFVGHNFAHLKKFLQFHKHYPVDGILADLGVSSHQFDAAERGFSYRFDHAIDMRMNAKKGVSAVELLNTYPIEQLSQIFYQYGELRQGRNIAKLIEKYRTEKKIETTNDLVEAVTPILFKGKENKVLSPIFQAIRIEVNQELEVLKQMLLQTVEALKPHGRIVVMSYHSLEDRLVKNFLRSGNFTGEVEKDFYGNPLTPFQLVTRKAVVASEKEVAENPRARSAKLRIAEKKDKNDSK